MRFHGAMIAADRAKFQEQSDGGAKGKSKRVPRAAGRILRRPETLALIREGKASKGDVLGVARIAAIQAAKRTAELIPLAHPLPLTHVDVRFDIDEAAGTVTLVAEART